MSEGRELHCFGAQFKKKKKKKRWLTKGFSYNMGDMKFAKERSCPEGTCSLCGCCFSLQRCKSAQFTKCDRTFWDTFKREVILRYKIQNQVGFCTDIGSFLMSYVRAGNKINSIPYSVWTVVLCFTQTYQLRFPLIQQSKNVKENFTCILGFFF